MEDREMLDNMKAASPQYVPLKPAKMQSVTISKVENGYAIEKTSEFVVGGLDSSKLWVAETKEKLLEVLGVILE